MVIHAYSGPSQKRCFSGTRERSLGIGVVDRDSELVAIDFDERDQGVMKMVSMAIQGAKRNARHSGLCGQAPSDYPDFAGFLVKEGIDSMSLNPDSVMKITLKVKEIEDEA